MPYDNIIISEQPLFGTISERRQSRKAFVENPVEIRNCFTAVKGEKPQSDAACIQLSNALQDRGQKILVHSVTVWLVPQIFIYPKCRQDSK